jgi:hypothetical protein
MVVKRMNVTEIEIIFKATENYIIQEIYNPKDEKYFFAIYDGQNVEFKESINLDGKTYIPLKSSLIEKKVVLFPSGIEEYYSTSQLVEDIKTFIYKYYEYPKIYEEFDAYFVLNTWNYDKFSVTPYRRILGDYGSGKTRFLDVVGSICYLPIRTSGAGSDASLFRTIDLFHGTVVIDEADLVSSNLYAMITKILNCGYKKGTPVLRTNMDTMKPEAFDVFCPKMFSSRRRFDDQALESRCITYETQTLTREDIPSFLLDKFYEEVETLRNKLLLYKLRNYRKEVKIDTVFQALPIEPRTKEVLLPLASIIDDPAVKKNFIEFAVEYQKRLIEERGLSLAKLIVECIIEMHVTGTPLAVGFIASAVWEEKSVRKLVMAFP